MPLLENQNQDKRVESISIPCLDAGSTPASSTSTYDNLLVASRLFSFSERLSYIPSYILYNSIRRNRK